MEGTCGFGCWGQALQTHPAFLLSPTISEHLGEVHCEEQAPGSLLPEPYITPVQSAGVVI